MTRADFINRLKNHINIDENNHVANADIEVEVFINSHIVNNTLIMKCFILICSVETLSMHTINTGYHPVYPFIVDCVSV